MLKYTYIEFKILNMCIVTIYDASGGGIIKYEHLVLM